MYIYIIVINNTYIHDAIVSYGSSRSRVMKPKEREEEEEGGAAAEVRRRELDD